jgi:hypothetical protein
MSLPGKVYTFKMLPHPFSVAIVVARVGGCKVVDVKDKPWIFEDPCLCHFSIIGCTHYFSFLVQHIVDLYCIQ